MQFATREYAEKMKKEKTLEEKQRTGSLKNLWINKKNKNSVENLLSYFNELYL